MLNAEEKEDLRHKVLAELVERFPAGIRSHRLRELQKNDYDELGESDVESALELLRGLGFAEYSQDGMGATKYWRATSAGVLREERTDAAKPPRHD